MQAVSLRVHADSSCPAREYEVSHSPPHSTPSLSSARMQYSLSTRRTAHICTCTSTVSRPMHDVRAICTVYVLTLPPSRSSSERGSHLCRARSEVGQSDADPLPGLWRLLYLITFTFSVFLLVVSRVVICSLSVCLSLRRMSLRRLCELAHRRGRRPTPDTRRPTVSFRILVLRTVAHWLARYSSCPPTRLWPRPTISREPRRSGLRSGVYSGDDPRLGLLLRMLGALLNL
ncbi:hypothetical protein OH76DRAFT_1190699 [Lentinus brumalis]|uniref:Uncharacterized protein n=1 Tax=Lentinus brumalis TaxID=2498619 RepID=A0A371CTK2_9APHY|nr:hypothetical protein OH76DRAFT_1190699 [Polyporus brumalis]